LSDVIIASLDGLVAVLSGEVAAVNEVVLKELSDLLNEVFVLLYFLG
jgi:hypothetical protein